MGRAIVGVLFGGIFTVVLISSASHGFLSRVSEMSRQGLLAFVGGLCLLTAALWFYEQGGINYIFWLYEVPTRPADERAFVSRVEAAMGEWLAETDRKLRSKTCLIQTVQFEDMSSATTGWVGTVTSTYQVGTTAALVVRIGRYTKLRTNSDGRHGAGSIDADTELFNRVLAMGSGDKVRFSGAALREAKTCIFVDDSTDQDFGADIVFKFTALEKV